MKTAVFPGTFDPFTLGHESIVRKAIPLFDKIIIAVGDNSKKTELFPVKQRVEWIQKTFADIEQIDVASFKGLTVDFCRSNGAEFILRGLRNPNDFQYESSIAQMNQGLNGEVLTVFLLCDAKYAAINSSIVREIHKNNGDVKQFLPESIVLPPFKA